MEESRKELSKDEFLEFCQKYAGDPDNSLERWQNFFEEYPANWRFIVYGIVIPVPPKNRVMVVIDFSTNEIRLSFLSEDEEDALYASQRE